LLGLLASLSLSLQTHEVVYAAEVKEEPKEVLIETVWSEEGIKQKIRETFPEDPDRAVAIAKCESGLNPKAVSPTNDHGLMQINKTVHTVEGDIYDVETNLKYARKLYDERKWQPWVCAKKTP
jgi:soluble lytic murein transglycosylase-like protein